MKNIDPCFSIIFIRIIFICIIQMPPHNGWATICSFNQITRSEEHTSELQSPCNLVCRLLLEKKKNTQSYELADIPNALDPTLQAIVLNEPHPEASFNRSLDLKHLYIVASARQAWEAYLSRVK